MKSDTEYTLKHFVEALKINNPHLALKILEEVDQGQKTKILAHIIQNASPQQRDLKHFAEELKDGTGSGKAFAIDILMDMEKGKKEKILNNLDEITAQYMPGNLTLLQSNIELSGNVADVDDV